MVAQVWRWPWRNRLCGGRKRWDVPAPVSFARYLVFVFQERRPPFPVPKHKYTIALTDIVFYRISFLNSVYVSIILSLHRYSTKFLKLQNEKVFATPRTSFREIIRVAGVIKNQLEVKVPTSFKLLFRNPASCQTIISRRSGRNFSVPVTN